MEILLGYSNTKFACSVLIATNKDSVNGRLQSDNDFFLFLIKDDVTEDEKDEADEKNRLISQVLELQNTLDGK